MSEPREDGRMILELEVHGSRLDIKELMEHLSRFAMQLDLVTDWTANYNPHLMTIIDSNSLEWFQPAPRWLNGKTLDLRGV